MKGDLIKILGILAIVAILVSLILAVLGMLGSVKLADGCFLRYDPDAKKGGLSDSITNTVMLEARANYTAKANAKPGSQGVALEYDPQRYGEWLNVGLSVVANQQVKFKIEGEISLCRAYMPENNIAQQSGSASNSDKSQQKLIPIPRLEEDYSDPLPLIFDATTDEWRNITELYNNDSVVISVLPNQEPDKDVPTNTIEVPNIFKLVKDGARYKEDVISADCRAGERKYSPLCGRYSIYSGQYVSGCRFPNDCSKEDCASKVISRKCRSKALGYVFDAPDRHCDWAENIKIGGKSIGGSWWVDTCDRTQDYWKNVMRQAPEPYQDDGYFTLPADKDINNIDKNFCNAVYQCSTVTPVSGSCKEDVTLKDKEYIQSEEYQKKRYFWFTAPTGLLYRIDNNQSPSNAKSLGPKYDIAKEDTNDEFYKGLNSRRSQNQKHKIIYKQVPFLNKDEKKSYLQYRFWSKFNDYSKNTGGYVLYIKHTKCRRNNGNSFDDPIVPQRGKVEYMIVPGEGDPNKPNSYIQYELKPEDNKGNASITAPQNGNVWMRIYNRKQDYEESYGRYRVVMFTSEPVGSFTADILNPLFKLLKGKVEDASKTVFQNMTCYGGEGNCTNFFNYIKAVLILYVMSYGAMFLLGMVKLNQQDLLIRIAKIAIVSGLMNKSTFDFFSADIFGFITNFSDGIMANMSGYSMFTTTNKITNPFMFLDAVMSKILFGKTFSAQLFSFLSMGLSGLIYFVITFIAVAIVVITALRAIAVYIMAFMATAVLIGIAPLFFTFMLFDFTRYLFENWVRFTIRYMIEPVVLMAGIIIMTQLFTIYLDFALGFSVCWKCALPIKFPIPNIGGFNPAFLDQPIFCISWFAPWGMDYRSGMMGVNMQHFIALIIIAYGMYGYVEFSGRMVAKLAEGGGPLATSMGNKMSSAVGQRALGTVGLDAQSRGDITNRAKDRLKARNKALDNANKARKKLNTNQQPQGSNTENEGDSNE
ncbi:type IV secretion system protein [Candidatus Tisiphia endosymbiont of Beris chalybata]|uniref:type IV secretion system protein n=1 Tax=Candidatus Tisiphia endosymbiont of Beris chalybata TaxID=3066262 RepID=UPI00312C7CAF